MKKTVFKHYRQNSNNLQMLNQLQSLQNLLRNQLLCLNATTIPGWQINFTTLNKVQKPTGPC